MQIAYAKTLVILIQRQFSMRKASFLNSKLLLLTSLVNIAPIKKIKKKKKKKGGGEGKGKSNFSFNRPIF